MKNRSQHSNILQQRITMVLALLFCLFISSVEYVPETISENTIEHQQDHSEDQNQNQTFLNVAVDAVIPFVVHVSHTVMHLIYQIDLEENQGFHVETAVIPQVNQLSEILFERIISTKGP
ncbi:hypothetical protein [Algoriphagus machipongonensis]|nr:hypothetical protein [Algoriphagus machipongonensis]